MAELALVINIIDSVKVTYQVAHYVYETLQSARNEEAEQKQIANDFRRELLFLASFRSYFDRVQGAIAYNQALDELWLLEIQQVIGHLKQDFSEYEDYATKNVSKSLGSSTTSLPLLTISNPSRSSSTSRPDVVAGEKSPSASQRLKDGQRNVYKKAR
ncbi:MAG: hypothetical protein Q9226_002159 [Calogaya cf. arnoldii]